MTSHVATNLVICAVKSPFKFIKLSLLIIIFIANQIASFFWSFANLLDKIGTIFEFVSHTQTQQQQNNHKPSFSAVAYKQTSTSFPFNCVESWKFVFWQVCYLEGAQKQHIVCLAGDAACLAEIPEVTFEAATDIKGEQGCKRERYVSELQYDEDNGKYEGFIGMMVLCL